jgi:hypothetical protein
MKKSNLSLKEVEQAIGSFDMNDQEKLLKDLPKLLKRSTTDLALLKVAESAFNFWDNPEDQVYDHL